MIEEREDKEAEAEKSLHPCNHKDMVTQGHRCKTIDSKRGLRQGKSVKSFLLVFHNMKVPSIC